MSLSQHCDVVSNIVQFEFNRICICKAADDSFLSHSTRTAHGGGVQLNEGRFAVQAQLPTRVSFEA
jgi:hypothetical protein